MSTVVAQPYSTAGNGGRKLVRLSNGWLVAGTTYKPSSGGAPQIYLYVSKDNGATFNLYFTLSHNASSGTIAGYSMASWGNDIYVVTSDSDYKTIGCTTVKTSDEGTSKLIGNAKPIDSSQTALGNVSLAIDPSNGTLHAAWSSKNSTYPNSFNIRYAKSTDGGITWSAVQQVTNWNISTIDATSPSIVLRNSNPVIAYAFKGGTNYSINAQIYNGTSWIEKRPYDNSTTYTQSSPSAVVDKDGVIHVAWKDANGSKMRYSKSADGGVTWSTSYVFSTSPQNYEFSLTVDKNKNLFIALINGSNIWGFTSNDGVSWGESAKITGAGAQTSVSTLYDPTFAGVLGNMPPMIYMTSTSVEYAGTYSTNNAPTVTLNTPDNNATLYENSAYTIAGNVKDADNGDIVNAKYSINDGSARALATGISDGSTAIVFNKSLTFKNGKLFDGDVAITDALAEGTAHTLKVWATDDKGATSTVVPRSFFVVPNRPPSLTINTPQPSGIIDSDAFNISGTCSDIDGNDVVVTYRINSGLATEVYRGQGADFSFNVKLGELKTGANEIVVEVIDTYAFKTSKTIKLNKAEIKAPVLSSMARYKVAPPKGSAKGVIAWIQREPELEIVASISAVLAGEQEQYVPMSKTATAPVSANIVEDEFTFEASDAKTDITIKLELKRESATISDAITLITGVLS